MSIDLKKLENKLDEALSNETNETLTKFLTDKRMSNNKQSSIEWLYFAMEGFIHKSARVHFIEYFEKAKAMHKEEMVKFALFFSHAQVSRTNVIDEYNETFGGNNEQQ